MKGSFQSNQDCLKSRSDLGHGFDSSLCTRQKCVTSAGSPQQSVSHGCFHGVSLAAARWTPFLAWSFHEISCMGPMHTSVDIHSRHTNQMSFQNSSKAAATDPLFNPCDLKGGQPDGANVARNPTLSSKRDAAPGLEARELSLHRSGPFYHFVVVSIF